MKPTIVLAALAAILCLSAAPVRGQSALDGFDPNANGSVLVVVVQPDGKILIGGEFTMLAPNGGGSFNRHHIARLNPDGKVDTTFNPDADNTVRAIAIQPGGQILIGGDFTTLTPNGGGTFNRNRLARLNPDGTLDTAFNPNPNDSVRAIALQADARILVGGDFTMMGAKLRNRMARLDASTGAADSFDPNASSSVFAIAVQPNGRILAGGAFTSIGGQPRNRIARLDATTGLADSFSPNANSFVLSIAVQADGKILASGRFTSIGGQTRSFIARLDRTTGLADSFNPTVNSFVFSIVLQADGKILAGGAFTIVNAKQRNRIVRLNPDGALDTDSNFNPNANGNVFSIALQPDSKILAGGEFSGANSMRGQTRNRIARLEIDGRLDQTLNLSIVGSSSFVSAIAVQTDGKIIIGGFFTTVLGVPRNHMARLNTDGTLDLAFNPNPNNFVLSVAVQADGRILVSGQFTSIGGQTRNGFARLDATFGLADSFNPDPNPSGFVTAIAVQADGRILAGGNFGHIGGAFRSRIARLDATTGLADSFDPHADSNVETIAVQADGKILVGGFFQSIGGATRNRIARIDATTGLADSFDPNANGGAQGGEVEAIAVQADGKILAGGFFTSIGGQTRSRIARLDGTTGLADSFNPNANDFVLSIVVQADGKILAGGAFTRIGGSVRIGIVRLDPTDGSIDSFRPSADNIVKAIAVQADGKVLAGGNFTNIGGQPRNLFARLTNDTAALENLTVTPTTIIWTRGGSSPQFTRATFESSPDNVNFTLLGNGIPQSGSSNWILTGLNLPAGQNTTIRARGFYRSGSDNGSESILGSRRNAFFSPPGRFVIGDGNAVVGQHVVFWGAQWARSNLLSGGPAPASFKGFANSTSASPPDCGGTWMSEPGNSAAPPAGVPATINVIVASSITKSGNVISGNIPEMAVVQTDPGLAGTGTVVSVGCDQ